MPFHFPDGNANWLTNAALDKYARIPEYKGMRNKIRKHKKQYRRQSSGSDIVILYGGVAHGSAVLVAAPYSFMERQKYHSAVHHSVKM